MPEASRQDLVVITGTALTPVEDYIVSVSWVEDAEDGKPATAGIFVRDARTGDLEFIKCTVGTRLSISGSEWAVEEITTLRLPSGEVPAGAGSSVVLRQVAEASEDETSS